MIAQLYQKKKRICFKTRVHSVKLPNFYSEAKSALFSVLGLGTVIIKSDYFDCIQVDSMLNIQEMILSILSQDFSKENLQQKRSMALGDGAFSYKKMSTISLIQSIRF